MVTDGLTKDYHLGPHTVHALRGVSVEIERGAFIAVMGPSGSGKSTFMNLLGCLDTPTRGRYLLDDDDVAGLSRDTLARIRSAKIGFVFQQFNLLRRGSAWPRSASPTASTTTRVSSLAGSSSASPSRVRSSTIRPWSWPTSRRATSTHAPAWKSWRYSSA